MITRIGALTLSALLSVSVFACEKTGEKEQSAEGRANKQADEAQNEAARKAAAAQAQADQKIAAARADFEKAREDYRHSRQADLDDLNRKIADLEARDRTATGKTKTDLDAALPVIRAQRDAFTRDMKSLESATPASWDGFKSRLDGEWDALKANVDKVS